MYSSTHTEWIFAPNSPVPPEVLKAAGNHPLTAEILYHRGMTDPEEIVRFLDPDAYTPANPYELPGMQEAVERIEKAIQKGEKILVWGDFDADGQTSTTILYSTLTKIGASVDYHIPLRSEEGHGIGLPELKKQLKKGIQLIITCDTGIGEVEPIQLAVSSGVDVIVTDHHEIPEHIPNAAIALVNPRFLPQGHPLSSLPGCGVAYELALALVRKFNCPDSAVELLDLVALGIVADVAEIRADTRYLLQRGLQVLRNTSRLGLQKLYEIAEIRPDLITDTTIGFTIAPRLNALGRLGDSSSAVEFFTTTDPDRAEALAMDLEHKNIQRRELTAQVLSAALQRVENNRHWMDDPVLLVDGEGWDGGILGLVANQLVNMYHKPTLVVSVSKDGKAIGSARSVEGINITQAITRHRDILARSGGHPMAAGFSLQADLVPDFRQMLNHTVRKMLPDGVPAQKMMIDAIIPFSKMKRELVRQIEILAPFGPGNPEPIICSQPVLATKEIELGKTGDHQKIKVEDANRKTATILWWGGAHQETPGEWIDLAYHSRMSSFNGEETLQFEWVDARTHMEAANQQSSEPLVTLVDHRKSLNQLATLETLRQGQSVIIFAEANAHHELKGSNRLELAQADILALWNFPPGVSELASIISLVKPKQMVLFGKDPGVDKIDTFLKRLTSILKKFSQPDNLPIALAQLAAATAQRMDVVDLGIHWLEARGDIRINHLTANDVSLSWVKESPMLNLKEIHHRLENGLKEASAFRNHLLTISSETWIRDYFQIK